MYIEVLPTKRPTGETKINGLWRRFENWLCEHTAAFCRWPLAPGASERDLQVFERTIGAKLPTDLRQSYLRHNGSASVRLLSVVGEGEWGDTKRMCQALEIFSRHPAGSRSRGISLNA